MSVLYVVALHWVIAAGPNDVFERRMDLTALHKEQIYKQKKKAEIKKALPFPYSKIFALCTNTSASPGIVLSTVCKSIHRKKKSQQDRFSSLYFCFL